LKIYKEMLPGFNISIKKAVQIKFSLQNILLFSTIIISSNCISQSSFYKESQVINMGRGETLKIIRCKGEGAQQLCELQHYINNRQVGNSFWLTANGIAIQRKARQAKPVEIKLKTILPQVVAGQAKNIVSNKDPIKKEAAKVIANAVVATAPPSIIQEKQIIAATIEVKEKVEPPKKVKKEFVSHNPFLSPQYKGNPTSFKQSADSSKVN
jgi:hypothetical protein